jgi:hypothetical protein
MLLVKADRERACRLGLFLQDRYENKDLRDRAAIGVVAHIKHHFLVALHPVEFFATKIVAGARKACRPTAKDLRQKKKNIQGTIKLPVCDEILYIIRNKLFKNSPWTSILLDNRMTYMGAMCVMAYAIYKPIYASLPIYAYFLSAIVD